MSLTMVNPKIIPADSIDKMVAICLDTRKKNYTRRQTQIR